MKTKFFFLLIIVLIAGFWFRQTKSVIVPLIETESNPTDFHFKNELLYQHDQPYSGFVVAHDTLGNLLSKTGYVEGKMEGSAQRWYANGKLSEERLYAHNQKTGRHQSWWQNGLQRFDYQFDADRPIGTHREWYANGKLFTLMEYNAEGQPEGRQQMWFDNGKIKANYVVKNGRRYGLLGAKGCMGKSEAKATSLVLNKN